MKELIKMTVIRLSKLLHYLLTILLFISYYFIFYNSADLSNTSVLHCEAIIFIYAVIVLFTLRTYSSYNVGLSRIQMLIYSQTISDLVSVGIMYILLSINRQKLINPLPLAGLLLCQFILNFLWSFASNTLYLHLNKARKTVIIYRDKSDLKRLDELSHYHQKFQVVKKIEDPFDDTDLLLSQLEGYEAVFITGVHSALRDDILKYCVAHDIRCYVVPHVGDVIMMGAKHMDLFSVPIFRVTKAAPKIEYSFIKRVIDIIGSLLGIIVFSPCMLITAIAVKLYDRGPILYKQTRLTKDGRKFNIMKFRSMNVNAEHDGIARLAAENDHRITPVGKIIRACRIDELPQLFNILQGNMSFVGPRPERPEIAEQYEQIIPEFSLRLQVKAGLTGLAQVYGKYNTDPRDKLRMDLMYINQMSLLQDIKLIFATLKVIFIKKSTSGISEGQTTAVTEKETKELAAK